MISLSMVPRGKIANIINIEDSSDNNRLQSLGFISGKKLEVITSGPTMVVRILERQIALSKKLANSIIVTY